MPELTDPLAVLKERFGFDAFRPGQAAAISALLAGRSAGAIFPTGSGKSICYQLPALMLPGLTLVISPLLALMKDQIDGLRAKGIEAERLDSSLDEEDYRRVTADIREQRVKLLFVAPERLANERFLNLIRGQRISLLAVDEAHCISSWGAQLPARLPEISQRRENPKSGTRAGTHRHGNTTSGQRYCRSIRHPGRGHGEYRLLPL